MKEFWLNAKRFSSKFDPELLCTGFNQIKKVVFRRLGNTFEKKISKKTVEGENSVEAIQLSLKICT